MPKQVPRAGAQIMNTAKAATKTAEQSATQANTESVAETKSPMTVVKDDPKSQEQPKALTLEETITKVESLKMLVTKRENLKETRDLLERFKVGSNDFNCTLRLSDTDGNSFNTTFTPGIKKVIEFMKTAFDDSIAEVENQIKF